MKKIKTALFVLVALGIALSFTACEGLIATLDWLNAPYGYVYDNDGNGVDGASVSVYRGTEINESNQVYDTVTTTSEGFFSLSDKVDQQGGTYIVHVDPPANSGLTYDDEIIEVASDDYLYNIGTIKPAGGSYNISGSLINVREGVDATSSSLPVGGEVELRVFGETTAVATASVSSGSYTLESVPSGSYLLTYQPTSTYSDWAGVPISVEVEASNKTDVGALVYDNSDIADNAILLVLTWENTEYDIDSHSMIGSEGSADHVYYPSTADSINNNNGNVVLERDVTKNNLDSGEYPVETTIVSRIGSTTAGTVNMRFYAKAYTVYNSDATIGGLDAGSDSKDPAGVTLYAMWNDPINGPTHFGTWFSPINTDEPLVGMAELVGDGSYISIGSFGADFSDTPTPRSLDNEIGSGVVVSEMK